MISWRSIVLPLPLDPEMSQLQVPFGVGVGDGGDGDVRFYQVIDQTRALSLPVQLLAGEAGADDLDVARIILGHQLQPVHEQGFGGRNVRGDHYFPSEALGGHQALEE